MWIWTAVIELPDGRRRVDFEVGDRSRETFLRWYERLPEAEWYYSDDYGVYGSWLRSGTSWARASWRTGMRVCTRSIGGG